MARRMNWANRMISRWNRKKIAPIPIQPSSSGAIRPRSQSTRWVVAVTFMASFPAGAERKWPPRRERSGRPGLRRQAADGGLGLDRLAELGAPAEVRRHLRRG